jgi:small basic protein
MKVMWLILIFIILGFSAGYYFDIPVQLVQSKYLALGFLALLDSFTYGLLRDLSGTKGNNAPIITRLVFGLLLGSFIIYFGEKSQIDLYMVAILPLALGFALNLYKFLPK